MKHTSKSKKSFSGVPTSIGQYFWDTNLATIDADTHAASIIRRILEFGDLPALRWLMRKYPQTRVKQALVGRGLSPRARAFWSCFFRHRSV